MATSLLAINNGSLYNMTGVTYAQGHLLLYINLNKDFQAEERLKYKDKFLSNKVLQWESQTGTTLTNGKGVRLIKQGKADIFVRKVKLCVKCWSKEQSKNKLLPLEDGGSCCR